MTSPLRGMRCNRRPSRTRLAGRSRAPRASAGSSLRSLGSVLRAALPAILHADRVERAADDVVANARQVLHAAAADEHHRVLLQVVADARDVGRDLDAVGEPDARDLAERRVRLLRRRGVDARAHAALLRRALQRRRLPLRALLRASAA